MICECPTEVIALRNRRLFFECIDIWPIQFAEIKPFRPIRAYISQLMDIRATHWYNRIRRNGLLFQLVGRADRTFAGWGNNPSACKGLLIGRVN